MEIAISLQNIFWKVQKARGPTQKKYISTIIQLIPVRAATKTAG
jgi:hypothetical protein